MSNKTIRVGRQTAGEAVITKNEILGSAFDLFSTKGFDATSIREIAAHADVSHGTIRHHFGSKLDIWFAIVDRHNALYSTELNAALSLEASSEKNELNLFKAAVSVLIKTLYDHPQMIRLISMEYDAENDRSRYLSENIIGMHLYVSQLFDAAKECAPRLKKYTSDTFLVALLGLISAPINFSILNKVIASEDIMSAEFKDHYQSLIMNILFGD
ncbi:TetR/AcrR family transcriptional regulator [Vibrio sp. 10N.261.51.F12]|uniref:TetR/AcrR family transcriptional regulator n=1 Tax=Vibrio sp. 10N.261.51.F12 TaxID=3229679 RepID=UPI00354D82D6